MLTVGGEAGVGDTGTTVVETRNNFGINSIILTIYPIIRDWQTTRSCDLDRCLLIAQTESGMLEA